MKRLATFALVVLSCGPATAQLAPAQKQSIELELLEMEQDVDKSTLREALVLQSRQGMKPRHGNEAEQKQLAEADAVLGEFIVRKKEAIIVRAAEMRKRRVAGMRAPTTTTVAPGAPTQIDWRAAVEKTENAQVESQLLQAQINLLQPSLAKAIELLAAAELAASDDEAQRPKADEARKAYEKVKTKYVDYSKRLRLEQQMGGMGGGFR